MASTNFIDKVTVVEAPWLNEVNGTVWTLFNAADTPALGRTALGLGTIATQDSNNVTITGGSVTNTTLNAPTLTGITSISGTISGSTSTGGDFVLFQSTAAGSEVGVRINATSTTSGSSVRISNSGLNVQSTVRGTSTGGLTFYTGQTSGAASTSGVQALDISSVGDVVVGNSPKVNDGRVLTVYNTDAGASAYSRFQVQTDAGSTFVQVNSIAGGRAANIYSSTGGALNIYTQDAQELRLGANNNSTRLTINTSGHVNAAVQLQENGYRVWSRGSIFTSTGVFTTVKNTTNTQAHGLGAKPTGIDAKLVCLVGELGYTAGDELPIWQTINPSNGTTVAIRADTTNIYIRTVSSTSNELTIPALSSNALVAIDPTNWVIIVKAWY